MALCQEKLTRGFQISVVSFSSTVSTIPICRDGNEPRGVSTDGSERRQSARRRCTKHGCSLLHGQDVCHRTVHKGISCQVSKQHNIWL